MEFGFLATVALAFGLLSWGHLILNNIIDLPYFRWMMRNKQFSSRNKLVYSYYRCEAALIQAI